jgi:hypothetical protein
VCGLGREHAVVIGERVARGGDVVSREPGVHPDERGDLVLVRMRTLVAVTEAARVPCASDGTEGPQRDRADLAIELRERGAAIGTRAPWAWLEGGEIELVPRDGDDGLRGRRGARSALALRRRELSARRRGHIHARNPRRRGEELGDRGERDLAVGGSGRDRRSVAIDRDLDDRRVDRQVSDRPPEPQVDERQPIGGVAHDREAAPRRDPDRSEWQLHALHDLPARQRDDHRLASILSCGDRDDRCAIEHDRRRRQPRARHECDGSAGRQHELFAGTAHVAPAGNGCESIGLDRHGGDGSQVIDEQRVWLACPQRRCGTDLRADQTRRRIERERVHAEHATIERAAHELAALRRDPELIAGRCQRLGVGDRDPVAHVAAADVGQRDAGGARARHQRAVARVFELHRRGRCGPRWM